MSRSSQTRLRRTACLFFLMVDVVPLSPPASCAPNGLTQIPIAKVFGDGVASFSVARAIQSNQTTTFTAQYGIGNVKYLVVHCPGHLPDGALGMTNVASGQKAVPYAVATTQPSATGLSLGVIRPTGIGYVGMAGVSYNVAPTVEIVGDLIGGQRHGPGRHAEQEPRRER